MCVPVRFTRPSKLPRVLSVSCPTGKEYAAADYRWGFSDPTVVALELLTVLGAGPLCCYILKQLVDDDPARHYWIVVLSTAELYGGWMTFCPEWLTGSPNLNTSNALHLWVYLFVSPRLHTHRQTFTRCCCLPTTQFMNMM